MWKSILLISFATIGQLTAQTPVSVVKPEVETASSIYRFTGTITSERSAAISPRVSGLVAAADADIGFTAKKGDILVSLDDTLARLVLEENKLNLETAKAELNNAKRLLDEAIDLGDPNFARSARESRETAFRKAELSAQRLETVLRKQQEIVERHHIIAPFDGVVSAKTAEIGEWAQTGRSVLNLVDTENLRLDLQVPQEQLDVVINSQTVIVYVAGISHLPFKAQIQARSPDVDPNNRTFTVRIRIDNPQGYIQPGMSAEADFQPDSTTQNLLIPRDAILRNAQSEVSVWVAEETGNTTKASRRVVALGDSNGNLIEITNGLNSDEQVIYQGNESLQEGQGVQIVDSIIPTKGR